MGTEKDEQIFVLSDRLMINFATSEEDETVLRLDLQLIVGQITICLTYY